MKKNELVGVAIDVVNIISELEVLANEVLKRICQLKNFEDSGSVEAEQMEVLGAAEKKFQKSLEDPAKRALRKFLAKRESESVILYVRDNIVNLERLKAKFGESKKEIVALNWTLDEYEKKFPKYNVPKCYGEPLEQYVARLRWCMKLRWKEPAEKNREKEQGSLIEWMQRIDHSNEPSKTTFDALKTVLIDHGTQISIFLIEYLMLVMVVISERKEITETLYEVETILRCLSVEENSIVINTFVSVLHFFDEVMRMAAILDALKGKGGEEEKKSCKEINFWLENEIEHDLRHLIIVEVLRLEVSFCHPDTPMTMLNEVHLAKVPIHLKDKIFKDKLNRVSAKVNELKKEMLPIRDEGSTRRGLLHKILGC